MQQLILPLDHPPRFDVQEFVISRANQEAFLWLRSWPAWPGSCLALYGDEGCGKTHLSHIWQENTGAKRLTGREFEAISLEDLMKGQPCLILDKAHLIQNEEKFFHIYNYLVQSQGGLLLIARTPPARWATRLPDLRSRLSTVPAIKIEAPDEALLTQVIQKLFADLQVRVDLSVIAFLLKHIERSFEEAHRWVNALNLSALSQKRSITIPLVREILAEQQVVEKESLPSPVPISDAPTSHKKTEGP